MPAKNHHSTLTYRPDVDGLRALAILLVVGYHAFPLAVKVGFIGVDIFFAISGYLIGGILLLNLKTDNFSFKNFYYRRIVRIFPALIATLLCCFVAGYLFLLPDELKSLGKHIIAGALFSENFLLWSEVGYFDTVAHTKPLLNLWSLGIEEQFYFIFPLFLSLLWKSKRSFSVALSVCVVLFFCLNLLLASIDTTADFYSPLSRFWELCAGALLRALETGGHAIQWMTGTRKKYLETALAFLACIVLIVAFLLISESHFPGLASTLPVGIALLFIASGPNNLISKIFLCNPLSVFIGKISYPLYLCHWPLLSFAYIINGQLGESALCLRGILVALSFLTAAILYYFIERPVRFDHILGKYTVPALLLGLIISVALGVILVYGKSLPFRSRAECISHITNQFRSPPFSNEICRKYIGLKKKDANFCLYKDMGADETIAIIGDSHAHAAYYGLVDLSEKMKKEGKAFNILCIARYAHNLVKGKGKNILMNNARRMVEVLAQKPEIKKVLLITRGMPWISSFSQGEEASWVRYGKTTTEGERRFIDEVSAFIGTLKGAGKEVTVQQDIPELPVPIKEAFVRTLGLKGLDYSWDKEKLILKKRALLEWEKPYTQALEAISSRTGAEILYSDDAFCPNENCLFLTPDGLPLYSDSDHLSVEGSKYQADRIFRPWLEKR